MHRRVIIPLVAFILTTLVMALQSRNGATDYCEPPVFRLGELSGYKYEVLPAGGDELKVLPSDTYIERRAYEEESGARYTVSLIIGGHSKSSIHRPELCLPSQGFQMTSPRDKEILGRPWHLMTLARKEATNANFAYTFFNQAGFRTSSHVERIFCDVWDRSVRGRIDRWAMITVLASTPSDAALERFLVALERSMK